MCRYVNFLGQPLAFWREENTSRSLADSCDSRRLWSGCLGRLDLSRIGSRAITLQVFVFRFFRTILRARLRKTTLQGLALLVVCIVRLGSQYRSLWFFDIFRLVASTLQVFVS